MTIFITEWIKFRTLRSTWWTLIAVAALPLAVAVLVAVTGSLAPDDTVLSGAVGNTVVGLVPAGILGALLAAGEHSGGTIPLAVAAVPRRWPLPLGKARLAAALCAAVALAAGAAAFGIAAALLPNHRPGDALPALFGVALVYSAVAVLGVALGTALRSTPGAVTAVTGLMLLPPLLGPVLTRAPWLADLTPIATVQQLLQQGGDWASVTDVVILCVASLGPATWALVRRDI